jgi:uncharacterized protein
MLRTAFSLVGLVLCILVWPATTRAQEVVPRSYLFVEVADAAGKAVVNATVRVTNVDGKELIKLQTGSNGTVKTSFERDRRPVHHYDLQITKAGYLPYQSVLFPNAPYDSYLGGLTDELPNAAGPSSYFDGPPVKITLQETPSTPAQEKKQQLLLAAKRGDAARLRKLLQEGVSANSVDVKGVPAVAWATFAGDPETIKLLLDAGARVRKRVALLIYLAEGVSRGRLQTDIIERMIEAGADVNASNSYQGTVLNKAIVQVPHALTIETIRSLIEAGANVNAADASGQTPLMLAARQNQIELLELLLNSGAKRSLNAKDKDGRSAFIYAAGGWRDSTLAIVKVLMANGATVTEVDEAGETPLMLAAKGGSNETIQILLKAGSSINAKDKQGQTALMYAVTGYNTPNPDTAQTIKLLLANGAGVNDVDAKGQSALMHAVRNSSDVELVKLLISNNANVNAINSEGETALMLAVQRFSSEIVQTLIEAGAGLTINAKDNKSRSALLYAVDHYGREDIVTALLAAGAFVDEVNENGQTPLMMAVLRVRPELVKLLLNARASIDIKDHVGNTALMYARNYGLTDIIKLLEEPRP